MTTRWLSSKPELSSKIIVALNTKPCFFHQVASSIIPCFSKCCRSRICIYTCYTWCLSVAKWFKWHPWPFLCFQNMGFSSSLSTTCRLAQNCMVQRENPQASFHCMGAYVGQTFYSGQAFELGYFGSLGLYPLWHFSWNKFSPVLLMLILIWSLALLLYASLAFSTHILYSSITLAPELLL